MTKTVSDEVADRMIRHLLNLERFKNHETAKVVRMMKDHVVPGLVDRLERRLKWIATRGVDKGVHSTKRLQDLVKFSKDYVKSGARRLYNEVAADMKALAVNEAEFSVDLLQATAPPQVPFEFVRPPNNLLRSIVNSQPMQGQIMKKWFDTIADNTQGEIVRQLNIGIAGGETIPQMARRMREATGMMTRQATTVVRTATNHVSNHARDAAYKANEDVVKGWKYVATLDTRTTPICMAEDGKVYDLDKGRKPPLHYNCRSTTVPVLKSWEELGIDAKELPPGTRASMNGQVPATQTYGKWLKGQPPAIQDEALGKKRAALFRQGKVTVKGLVNRNGKPLTLEQLRAKGKKITGGKAPKAARPQTAEEMLKDLNYAEIEAGEAELDVLRRQIQEMRTSDAGYSDVDQRIWDARSALEAKKTAMRKKMADKLILPKAQQVGGLEMKPIAVPPLSKAEQKACNGAAQWVRSVTSKDIFQGGRVPHLTVKKMEDDFRSGYFGLPGIDTGHTVFAGGDVLMAAAKGGGALSKVLIHEIGHHIETTAKNAIVRMRKFLLSRAKRRKDRLIQLKQLQPTHGFNEDEVTLPDKFSNPYMGKVYDKNAGFGRQGKYGPGTLWSEIDENDIESTELLSMGIEKLYADPLTFAMEDPEYFKLIVNVLRGV